MASNRGKSESAVTMILRTKILCGLLSLGIVSCALSPTLEQLEDEASTTGDWTGVERREEVMKERREKTAPGCWVGTKVCFEELSGIECYCIPSADRN